MDKKYYNNLDVDLTNFNQQNVPLIRDLVSDNMNVRTSARNKLVGEQKDVLPDMYNLFSSENELLRWEASKIIQEIASPDSIPFLISLLKANESEIRWIAAEGLINVGRVSIKPLLENLITEHEVDYFLHAGAHHVLSVLFTNKEKELHKRLLDLLTGKNGLHETVPVMARKALKEEEAELSKS